jgi:MHS family proline/betaine transporter-like MFS transporter
LKVSYSGALPAYMAEIFPTQTRVTGMSISYNISVPLFGGFAPFFIASLIALTHSSMAPSFYMMFTAVLGLITLAVAHRRLRIR